MCNYITWNYFRYLVLCVYSHNTKQVNIKYSCYSSVVTSGSKYQRLIILDYLILQLENPEAESELFQSAHLVVLRSIFLTGHFTLQ